MTTCAFANAVLWKTRIYAKVSKCGIWKMRCTYYALGILLLLIFQVMSSNTDHWGVMKLFSREREFSFPQSMISHCATPLSPDSSLSSCTVVHQTSHQLLSDLHRLKFFKPTLRFLKICSKLHPSYFPLPYSISKGRFLFSFVVLFR